MYIIPTIFFLLFITSIVTSIMFAIKKDKLKRNISLIVIPSSFILFIVTLIIISVTNNKENVNDKILVWNSTIKNVNKIYR